MAAKEWSQMVILPRPCCNARCYLRDVSLWCYSITFSNTTAKLTFCKCWFKRMKNISLFSHLHWLIYSVMLPVYANCFGALTALFHDFPTYFCEFVLALWLRDVCYYKREKEKYVRPSFQVISVFQIHFMVWIFPLCCIAEEFKGKKTNFYLIYVEKHAKLF